jgi:NAD(P)-dependent dehydrogenase (short-subunit alcohol dehydrogenase family)
LKKPATEEIRDCRKLQRNAPFGDKRLRALVRAAVVGEDELNGSSAAIAAAGREATAVAADLSTAAGIETVLEVVQAQQSPVTVLVNNAGAAGPFGTLWQVDPGAWERLLALNLTAPFRLTNALLPGMITARFGRIVNVCSSAGRTPLPRAGAYSSAKAGLELLTRQLAAELAELEQDVAVTAFAPGPSDTAAYAELRAQPRALVGEANFRRFRDTTATGRLSPPQAVAAVVIAMACEPTNELSGAYVDIDDVYAQSVVARWLTTTRRPAEG